MGDDQNTSGTSVNPATDSHAPRQAASVMDVTPPSASMPTPPVVAAPPETDSGSDVPPVSDDIAQQIAADAVTPSESTSSPAPAEPQAAPAADTPKPAEDGMPAVHPEPKPKEDQPAPATVKVPKPHNPARGAIIATVIMTVILACLAVFAYMSTQK